MQYVYIPESVFCDVNMQSKKFIKTKENFICEQCGLSVVGDGYTNHCPQCLWSKHVDVHPGDRKATCNGMMRPVQVEYKSDTYVIVHRCVLCKHTKRNKSSPMDNFEAIIQLSATPYKKV